MKRWIVGGRHVAAADGGPLGGRTNMGFPLSIVGCETYEDHSRAGAALTAIAADLRVRPFVSVSEMPGRLTYLARPLGRSWKWTGLTDGGEFWLETDRLGRVCLRYDIRTRGLLGAGLIGAVLLMVVTREPFRTRVVVGAVAIIGLTGVNYLLAKAGLVGLVQRSRQAAAQVGSVPGAS
jgi:hypothetical protein